MITIIKPNMFRGLQITEDPPSESWLFGGINGAGNNLVIGDEPAENIRTDSISQFTGYTDQNGTKIFEGDVAFSYSLPVKIFVKVVFNQAQGRYEMHFLNDVFYRELNASTVKFWKVVGNIYQTENLVDECRNLIEGGN